MGSTEGQPVVRILLIEDDTATADYIAGGLGEEGHVVDIARNGKDGLFLALNESYDVIVTDRMLPGPDGLAILRALRASNISTPVLVLTALGEVDRKVEGFEAGADDYLAKPFAFAELRARVRALARRPAPQPELTERVVGDLRLDLLRRRVARVGREIELLPTEFRLLDYMMQHPGEVLTRTMLLEKVWDFSFDPTTNVVDVHVSRLRRKLEAAGEPPMIRTVRGAGYMLAPAIKGAG
jgi:two-component system OmpR family response regulator